MMRLPKMADYYVPESLEDACSLLDEHGKEARILAGGTDLLVACKLRNIRPAVFVSLRKIEELKGISFDEKEGLRIGAMSSLYEVRSNSSIIEHYPALAQAAAAVGAMELQYMGTLGGNLCLNTRCIYYNQSDNWRKSRPVCFKMGGGVCHVVPKGKKCYAVFSADTAPALIALNAKVKLISSAGERIIDLGELYTGDGKEPIDIKPGEVLSEISVPPPARGRSSIYLKYRVREAIDFPLAGVAARMDSDGDGICSDCKVVLNAVGSGPAQVPEAGELVKGQALKEEVINEIAEKAVKAAHPVANTSGSTPAYRRKMAGILTKRTLITVAQVLGLV